jgi:hypothetical protein
LPDTLYYNNDKQNFSNIILRNKVNGSYEYQLDSSSSLKITADGGDDHKITNLNDSSDARASDNSLVNQAFRKTSSVGDNYSVNSNIIFRKKFKKKGRTLSFNFKENYADNTSTGYLYSDNKYYLGGIINKDSLTDEYKTIRNENTLLDGKLTYSEPINKISSLVFNYGLVVNNSLSEVNSFNKNADGKYLALDSSFSSDYKFNILTNGAGAAYSLFKKKLKLNIGTNIAYTNFTQTNMNTDSVSTRNFINWYPSASMTYQFSQQRRLFIRYNGNTQQPTIQQLQPLLTNNDPLNITIGNPLLKPSFQNNLSFNFSDYKILSDRSIWMGADYSFPQNNISTDSYIDSFGRNVTQYVNLNGNHTLNGYIYYGIKIKKPDVRINFNANVNESRYVSIVNNENNVTNSGDYTFGVNFNKEKQKKYSLNLNLSATYTTSTSSIQSGIVTKYWQYDIDPNGDVYLPKKFQIHSDCDFNLRPASTAFPSTNVILWNAWIGKKFLKNDVLLVKIIANDLLDNNIGFSRSVNSNFITQNTYSTIRRYFLLGVTWNFNKAGTKAPSQDN